LSAARDDILGAIRRSLGRGELKARARATLTARLNKPKRNLIPQRALLPHGEQIELFMRMATAQGTSVEQVAGKNDIPAAVANYLAGANLPTALRLAPDPWLLRLPWASRPLLTIEQGRADPADPVGVTPAFAGIAETGTLMLISGAETPTTLNFLPDTHIVVLRAEQVVGPYEEAWTALRDKCGRDAWPRTVNLITGPSRTADIAQELIMGAHGPRRLHIVLVDDGQA
jgi:L-lactate dehydrogenase complex protein LldG